MVKTKTKQLETKLRKQVSRFLFEEKQRNQQLSAFLKVLEEKSLRQGWTTYLCGGALRNLILEEKQLPRDLDIVINFASYEELKKEFSGFPSRPTNLGGICLQIQDWSIDIWPLSETWALKRIGQQKRDDIASFLQTTFLDIDAIAVQLFAKTRKKREIYSKGFFEAIENNCIEVNLAENPNPSVCIVKSLMLRYKFGFQIGPRLSKYILNESRNLNIDYLKEIYKKRYQISDTSIFNDVIFELSVGKQTATGCSVKKHHRLKHQTEFSF
jgi:hypothetical protein